MEDGKITLRTFEKAIRIHTFICLKVYRAHISAYIHTDNVYELCKQFKLSYTTSADNVFLLSHRLSNKNPSTSDENFSL